MTAPLFRARPRPVKARRSSASRRCIRARSRPSIAPRWVRHDAAELPARIV